MIHGDISNIPAPSIYIDGVSLFYISLFGKYPKMFYKNKIIKLLREVNVVIYLEKGKLTNRQLEQSPFVYTEIIKMSLKEFKTFLRQSNVNIFCTKERSKNFLGQCYLLDNSIDSILDHLFKE